jgi:hypothetical protein
MQCLRYVNKEKCEQISFAREADIKKAFRTMSKGLRSLFPNRMETLVVHSEGFEPPTLGAEIRYSIQLNYECKQLSAKIAHNILL